MADDPPPTAQTSIGDHNQITDSTVNLTTNVTHQAHPWQPRGDVSAAEAQALLDTMPRDSLPDISPLPSVSRMPFAHNPHFVGRDDVLLALATALHGGARVAIGPKAAATGLGGIGKTSVAVEFVHRYGTYFAGGVFWLSFADPAAIGSEIAACGGPGLLDLHPSYGTLRQDEQLALVRQSWQQPIPRLLIFDNAEDPLLVQQWVPASGGCRVLITSRRQTWPSSLGVTAQSLDVLARGASVALLCDLALRLTEAEANEIAEELGDFPLALQLAGSYLAQYARISVAAYLTELRSDVILAHPSLRGVHDGDVSATAHDRHVGRTFLVSYQRLDPVQDALALALLARAACLAPGAPIPQELLLASAELGPEDVAGQIALGRLIDLAFVTLPDEGLRSRPQAQAILYQTHIPNWASLIVLHRLVHVFITAVAYNIGDLYVVEKTLCNERGKYYYPLDDDNRLYVIEVILPHLLWLTRSVDIRIDIPMMDLYLTCGGFLSLVGRTEEVILMKEKALMISEQELGLDHETTASIVSQIASLFSTKKDYKKEIDLLQRSWTIYTNKKGAEDNMTISLAVRLAKAYRNIGNINAAHFLYGVTLKRVERLFGDRDPTFLSIMKELREIGRA